MGPMFGEIGKHYGALMGPTVGFVAIGICIAIAVGLLSFPFRLCIPVLGDLLAGILHATVTPHLLAGAFFVTLAQLRGKPWTFGDFFAGFRHWVPLFVLGIFFYAGFWLCRLPGVLMSLSRILILMNMDDPNPVILTLVGGLAMLLQLVGFLGFFCLWARFLMVTPFLVMEHGLAPIDAIKRNIALNTGHFWSWLGLLLLYVLIGGAGVLACGVGLLFTAGLHFILMTAFYRQVIGEVSQAPAPSSEAASAAIKPASA
jgi:hypothetical protein